MTKTTIGLGIDNYVDIIAGGNATISFTVPVTALPGTTRLRLVCVYFPDVPMIASALIMTEVIWTTIMERSKNYSS